MKYQLPMKQYTLADDKAISKVMQIYSLFPRYVWYNRWLLFPVNSFVS